MDSKIHWSHLITVARSSPTLNIGYHKSFTGMAQPFAGEAGMRRDRCEHGGMRMRFHQAECDRRLHSQFRKSLTVMYASHISKPARFERDIR